MDMLEIKNLETQFRTPTGIVHAVNGVSLSLKEGETIGLVGESGSGKSVSMLSLLGLIPSPPGKVVNGTAKYMGRDLLSLSSEELRFIRGSQISMIFQDPMTSFNPVLTIGRQVSEPLEIHLGMSHSQAIGRVVDLLELVGIPRAKERLNDYPHQFSGGMRQRVMIAMALACNPSILIADEPTTALDVTVQAQILDLVRQIQNEMGMAIIWITHDLGVVAGLAQRVVVMYGGYFVEEAKVDELFNNPRHPYTIGLLGSMPRLDTDQRTRLISIEGSPPIFFEKPNHCPFAPRCNLVMERCWHENPTLEVVDADHRSACWVDIDTRRERL
jgi:oligopeptide transport system ATP-binding protein